MPKLEDYDYIVVNTSGGKDSQTTMRHVVTAAAAAGVASRVLAVHADLGHEEWPGARELAEKQSLRYGLRFEVVKRSQSLLDHVRERRMWPSSTARYCTSDHKRDQVAKLITALVSGHECHLDRPIRILNCMGMRADESPARAKLTEFGPDKRLTNGRRTVDRWLPIHSWKVDDVWNDIHASGVPHHYAYDLGMPRLSCVFCIFAPKAALILAGKHNPELLAEYVAIEKDTGHTFRKGFTIQSVADAIAVGETPQTVPDWRM